MCELYVGMTEAIIRQQVTAQVQHKQSTKGEKGYEKHTQEGRDQDGTDARFCNDLQKTQQLPLMVATINQGGSLRTAFFLYNIIL